MKKILSFSWLLFYAVAGFSQNNFPLSGSVGTRDLSLFLDPGTNLTIYTNNSYSSLIFQNNEIDMEFFYGDSLTSDTEYSNCKYNFFNSILMALRGF